jgi:hypothetical protein
VGQARGVRRWVLGLACLCALASPAGAFECKYPDGDPTLSLYWAQRTLSYGVVAASGLDPEVVRGAVDAWGASGCSDLRFEYVGLVAEADPVSQATVVTAGWAAGGRAPSAVAVTQTFFNPQTGIIERAIIEVNEELYDFTDAAVACDGVAYDLPSVLTHEAGHFLGLGHTTAYVNADSDPTMAPEVGPCETYMRTLADDDEAGLCFLYPAGASTGRCRGLPEDAAVLGNAPFGCAAGPAAGDGAPWLILAALMGLGGRRGRRDTCPRVRSGG